MKLEFCRQIFGMKSNTKFYVNPSSGRGVVPRGRRGGQTDRQTDMKKLIVAFHNLAHAPKMGCKNFHY